QLKRSPRGKNLRERAEKWIPANHGDVRTALRDLVQEVVESGDFYSQEEEEEKRDTFDPKVTFKSQDGVRSVEHAVDRDFRRMLKRPGGDAFFFKLSPSDIRPSVGPMPQAAANT